MGKLKDRQERYCQEYLVDLHVTNAAIRAGYSEKTAYSIGSENMKKPEILERIAFLKSERAKRVGLTQDDVLKHLKNWLESDITETIGLTPEELKKLPLEIRQLISSYKHKSKSYEVEGKTIKDEEIELKFVSKEKALDMIAKHIGFYGEHNAQKQTFASPQMSASEFMKFVEDIGES